MAKLDREQYIQDLGYAAYLYIYSIAIQLQMSLSTIFSSLQFDNKYTQHFIYTCQKVPFFRDRA
jgi:hypothetical protein